jgi:hypothetical protein
MSTGYVAVVLLDTLDPVDADVVKALLGEYDPVLATSPSGWPEVRINLPANHLAQACKSALAVVAAATGARAIGCEVMTASEFDERRALSVTERGPRRQDGPFQ